ncbi:HNH endonuclease signature motif containing protein [Microbacterium sp. BK668]|uniref:HNH endonuclease signature motif containing protein n=1 Tax=Microbacterium sp. BK668 TaxID=2512118 RepID=UPI00106152B9|nr:HNH endonuclease signature motif containing protein [Microbacterium sp. BK668]TDN91264.1 uncharacterized protein DUF222 [Microbacterium sp. BK668]
MTRIVNALEALASRVDESLAPGLRDGEIRGLTDGELLEVLRVAAYIQRRLDAVVMEGVGEVDARSQSAVRDERLSSRLGCHDVVELVERVTRLSRASATRFRRAARGVVGEESVTTGEVLEPALPALRGALLDGVVGVDGVLAASAPLLAMEERARREDVLAADAVLAAQARGEAPDWAPPASADLLRVHAQTWAVFLDQDGAEPRDRRAARHRALVLGTATDRGVPVRGMLLPDVAAQLRRIFDSLLSPKVSGVRFIDPDGALSGDEAQLPPDDRTRAQKQHDALATALGVAAASGELPTVGGAAPTLVVSVRAQDLHSAVGEGHAAGSDVPIAPAAVRRVGCAGVIQRVALGDGGRIHRLGTEERVFNRHQRRAIALRDGACVIPGCGVPAGWCEIHHVTDHALGGPTHTDNGVLLCWYHHRHLDTSGWSIRMTDGVPEVRAPQWFDPSGRWRRVTSSKVRLLDVVRRQ